MRPLLIVVPDPIGTNPPDLDQIFDDVGMVAGKRSEVRVGLSLG